MSNFQKILLSLLILFAFFIRFYKIEDIPNGLYYDEVDSGYQARSLIQTGKDYRGSLSPFFINSNVEQRTPIPVYITVISTLLFKSPVLQVRMGEVILGTLNVFLVFILIRIWRKNFWTAIITALVFATNPWQIQFSRFNHEANSTTFMVLLSLILFFKAIYFKKYNWLILSAVFLSFGMYTYRTMSLYVPMLILFLFLIYKSKLLFFGSKKLFAVLGLILIITLPFLFFTTIASSDSPRIKQISVFSDPKIPIWIQRFREFDSNDLQDSTIGKKAISESYFFHNKPLSYFENFYNNYLGTFSADFLFTKGDLNHRHSIMNQGMLFKIDILALVLGLFYLLSNLKVRENRLILSMFLLSPIPSSLTIDGGSHAGRLFIFSLPLLLIIGMGWITFYNYFKKIRFFRFYSCLLIFIWAVTFIIYLHNYFVHYRVDSARYFSYGFRQAVEKIVKSEPDFQKVILTQKIDPPVLHYLFWANIPPKDVSLYGSQFGENIIKNMALDKIKVSDNLPTGNMQELVKALKPKYLYLLTQSELPDDLRFGKKPPEGLKVLQVITYPDNQVDLYLVAKDDTSISKNP